MLTQESMCGTGEPERPALLGDVAEWLFHRRGSGSENTYIVGSLTADRYLAVPESKLPAVRAFMQRLNGENTLNDIRRDLAREHGLELDVIALYRKFCRAGLLVHLGRQGGGDIQQSSTTFMRVPIGLLLRALRTSSFLAEPLLYMGVIVISLALIAVFADPSLFRLAADSTFAGSSILRNVWLSVLIGCFSVLLHELSHCFAAASWGIVSGTLRFDLYLGLIPIVGLKLAGLYTLPARGRLAVWSAGVLANLSIAGTALLMLRTVLPGSATLELVATINWLMAIFNLIPLLATDGYYILSTLVKDSNVRVRAWDLVRSPLRPGQERPSWFVLMYIVSTASLLLSTLWHLALRIAFTDSRYPLWQSIVSGLLLALFIVTLWRTIRRKEEPE